MSRAWRYVVRDFHNTVVLYKIRAWQFFYWSMPGVVQARTDELVRQNSVRATMLYLRQGRTFALRVLRKQI